MAEILENVRLVVSALSVLIGIVCVQSSLSDLQWVRRAQINSVRGEISRQAFCSDGMILLVQIVIFAMLCIAYGQPEPPVLDVVYWLSRVGLLIVVSLLALRGILNKISRMKVIDYLDGGH